MIYISVLLLLHWLRIGVTSASKLFHGFISLLRKIGKSKGKNQSLYYLYLEVVSITNSKSQSVPEAAQHTDSNARSSQSEHFNLYTFSPRDLEFIVKFSEEHGSDVFRQILQSICPSIYGHELVKGMQKKIVIDLLRGHIYACTSDYIPLFFYIFSWTNISQPHLNF